MKRRLMRTVPASVFYSSVVEDALAVGHESSMGDIDAEMRGAALRQQRGTRRERLEALRQRLQGQQVARESG